MKKSVKKTVKKAIAKQAEPVSKELVALIHDVKTAYKHALSSGEFKNLERNIAKGTKVIAESITHAYHRAQTSPETAKLGRQLKKVASSAATSGKNNVHLVQRKISQVIAKARKTIGKKTAKASR